MKQKQQKASAAGALSWIPQPFQGSSYQSGVAVSLSEGATLTYSVEFSLDNPYKQLDCSISRSATTATVTFKENHGKAVGDSIQVNSTREDNLAGVHAIASVPSETTLTYTVSDTGSTSENAKAVLYTVYAHPDLSALSANAEAGFVQPPTVVRLNVTAYTSGTVTANYTYTDRP